jgi:hypothetical protein
MVGRKGFELLTPAMSRLIEGNNNIIDGITHWFESDPSQINWQQFQQYLLQRMTAKTAEDRVRYAKQFVSILTNGDAHILLSAPPNKRIHIMKSLSCLAKYTGDQENWLAIRRKHGLTWSTGTEKLDAFSRFFDDSKDLDTMITWLKEAMQVLPDTYSNFFLFCTLTGMRCSEALDSVKLIKNPDTFKRYYDPDGCLLRHYAFSDPFIRRTKAVYISIVNDKILSIAQNINPTLTINALKMAIKHRNLSMQLKYCRKIYASFLRHQGIQPEIIDMLQGRIGKNIFLRHYLTPSSDYKNQVLQALEKLQSQLQ